MKTSLLVVLCLVVGLFVDYLAGGHIVVNNLERLITKSSGGNDSSVATRVETPLILFSTLSAEQLCIGHGLGSLVRLVGDLNLAEDNLKFKVPTLNNYYLNFLVEFGFIALLLFLGSAMAFLISLAKKGMVRRENAVFVAFIVWLIYLFNLGHLNLFGHHYLGIVLFVYLYFESNRPPADLPGLALRS